MAHPDCPSTAAGAYRAVAMRSILTVLPGQSLQLTIVSPEIRGAWTHFIDGHRTYPCLGPSGVCYFDHLATSCRWQGWLQVITGPSRASRFVCLTEAAARDTPQLWLQEGRLAGRQLVLQRAGHSKRGRLVAICGFPQPDITLPPPVDLRRWLLGMWEEPSMWPLGLNGHARQHKLQVEEVFWDDNPFDYRGKKGLEL